MGWLKKPLTIILIGIILPIGAGLLVHFAVRIKPPREFSTLLEIVAYGKSLKELPTADNEDWENPQFDSFYRSRNPGPFSMFLRFLGLWRSPPFSPKYLSTVVQQITEMNQKMGLTDGRRDFVHIKAHKETRVIVFGDVHAAFHSLLRDLTYLKQQDVIANDLQIKEPYTYFVFNGDFIDRSPYNIDSLILICLLMKKNPDRVFYVAGRHEREGYWLDYSLKSELVIRGRIYSQQTVPFLKQMIAFFSSLPEAVYVSGKNDQKQALRISFNERDELSYDESLLSPSFIIQEQDVAIYKFTPRRKKEPELDIRAVIKTEDWRSSNRIKNGLGQLNQQEGATTWAVLSSPIMVNRIFLKFFDDAFGTVMVNHLVLDASISLTYQNATLKDGFRKKEPFNIISARKSKRGPPHEIKVGSTLSLVRGQREFSKHIKSSISILVNEFNRKKHETASEIRVYIARDDYIPKLARQNTQRHLEQGIRLFLLPLGTPTLLAYMDLIEKSRSGVFFPVTGAGIFRSKKYSRVVHLRGTNEDEVRILIRTLRKDYGSLKFALFYQDDAYGRGPMKAAVNELKRLGINNVLALPYTRGRVTFQEQAEKILLYAPDALGFLATATAAIELMRQVGVGELITPQLFGLSSVLEIYLRRFLSRKGLPFIAGSPVPNPRTSKLPIAQAYRKAMDADKKTYDLGSFEAYIAASIFLNAVSSVKSVEPTADQILNVIENLKDYEFQGLNLTFNKETRSLAKYVWVETKPDHEWPHYPIDQPTIASSQEKN